MQKSMQELKRRLEETNFDVSSGNGIVKINMNAAQKINSVNINGNLANLIKPFLRNLSVRLMTKRSSMPRG